MPNIYKARSQKTYSHKDGSTRPYMAFICAQTWTEARRLFYRFIRTDRAVTYKADPVTIQRVETNASGYPIGVLETYQGETDVYN